MSTQENQLKAPEDIQSGNVGHKLGLEAPSSKALENRFSAALGSASLAFGVPRGHQKFSLQYTCHPYTELHIYMCAST